LNSTFSGEQSTLCAAYRYKVCDFVSVSYSAFFILFLDSYLFELSPVSPHYFTVGFA